MARRGPKPREIPDTPCLQCGEPFGRGAWSATKGDSVGVGGLIHVRCYRRLYGRLSYDLRRKGRAKAEPPSVIPGPRPSCRPKPSPKRPSLRTPTLPEGRSRLDAMAAADAVKVILRSTRRVFAGRRTGAVILPAWATPADGT